VITRLRLTNQPGFASSRITGFASRITGFAARIASKSKASPQKASLLVDRVVVLRNTGFQAEGTCPPPPLSPRKPNMTRPTQRLGALSAGNRGVQGITGCRCRATTTPASRCWGPPA
jgi:hypothetical protein